VLETNTFGANRVKLSQYGLESQVREINRAAARIAREVASDDHLVAGAVGPLGVRIEPYGPTSIEEAFEAFLEQMSALKEGGVDCFLLETFGDLAEIAQAVRAARAVDPTIPVIAQMTIGVDGRTSYGASPEDLARTLDKLAVDVIGLNCSVGPQAILEAIEKMATVTRRKLSAQPNAGMPRDVGGRSMYMASPEYMASYARHLIHAGAKIIGGCCGTTPSHIRAIVQGVRPLAPRITGTGNGEQGTGTASSTPVGATSSGSPFPRRSPAARWSPPSRSYRHGAWTRARCCPTSRR
jgi:homocysteine S-methyltransferase